MFLDCCSWRRGATLVVEVDSRTTCTCRAPCSSLLRSSLPLYLPKVRYLEIHFIHYTSSTRHGHKDLPKSLQIGHSCTSTLCRRYNSSVQSPLSFNHGRFQHCILSFHFFLRIHHNDLEHREILFVVLFQTRSKRKERMN